MKQKQTVGGHVGSSAGLVLCPFCGGTPALVTRDVEPQNDSWYGKRMETFVLCDCGCCLFDGEFHEGFWDAETRAVAAWNKRANAWTGSLGVTETKSRKRWKTN